MLYSYECYFNVGWIFSLVSTTVFVWINSKSKAVAHVKSCEMNIATIAIFFTVFGFRVGLVTGRVTTVAAVKIPIAVNLLQSGFDMIWQKW